MTGIIEVEILGAKRPLVFNNYARVELGKHFDVDPVNILASVQELNDRNHLLLIKRLVYAGHCGDCYRRQDVTDLTVEQIGEWLGDASDEVLYNVFRTFIESEGFDLPDDSIKKKAPTKAKRKAGTK